METSILDFCKIKFRSLLRPLVVNKTILYSGVADWFVFSLFVLPSYFGIRLVFFDLTAIRFFEILLLIGILKKDQRKKDFISLLRRCSNNMYVFLYMFVVTYTNLIHPSVNTIFYWITNVVLVIYLVSYLVVYEYGIEKFLAKIRKCVWIIVCLSPLELIIGKSPFSLLDTLNKSVTASRFGSTRITGNCTTPNGYAMFLMILLPLFCYDWKKNKINLGKNKILISIIALNIILTGSRLTMGTLVLGLVLCFFLQPRTQLKKSLMFCAIALPVLGAIIYLLRDISFFQSILRTFFSAVDEILNTNYSVKFGADAHMLYNSSHYRELLWENTILGDWLNPWLGRGGNYRFGMYIDGYRIFSVDNFYVGQYITYAWPGVITWLLMSLSFFRDMLVCFIRKNILGFVMMVSFICYYISLWYLDQLQTYMCMAALFGIIYGTRYKERYKVNSTR